MKTNKQQHSSSFSPINCLKLQTLNGNFLSELSTHPNADTPTHVRRLRPSLPKKLPTTNYYQLPLQQPFPSSIQSVLLDFPTLNTHTSCLAPSVQVVAAVAISKFNLIFLLKTHLCTQQALLLAPIFFLFCSSQQTVANK